LAVGLTVVAFGTSAPELVVTFMANLSGNVDIGIGNIVGSNIANILLILGVAGIITPIKAGHGTVWKEIPFALLSVLALGVMANDAVIDGRGFSDLGRIDGLVMLIFFVIFMYYTFSISKAKDSGGGEDIRPAKSALKAAAMIVGGLTALVVGGQLVVSGASGIARAFGVSEALIGLTIVSVGTSLPELVTSAMAAYRKEMDIAVGNVVGSNIFNVFLILGISAVTRPMAFSADMAFDVAVAVAAAVLLFAVMFIGQRNVLQRWQAGAFVALYFVYIGSLVIRQSMGGVL
jgi:cation:H+ antiporter